MLNSFITEAVYYLWHAVLNTGSVNEHACLTSSQIKKQNITVTLENTTCPLLAAVPLPRAMTFLTSNPIVWLGLLLNFIQVESYSMYSSMSSFFYSTLYSIVCLNYWYMWQLIHCVAMYHSIV